MRNRIYVLLVTTLTAIILICGYRITSAVIEDQKGKQKTAKIVDRFLQSNGIAETNPDKEQPEFDITYEIDGVQTIGVIKIQELNVTAPIGYGIDEDTLQSHVGMYPDLDEPGKKGGVAAFAAHSSRAPVPAWYCFFQNLDDLEPGDEIEIIWNDGKTYEYEVMSVRSRLDPEDFSDFEAAPEKEKVVLQTCTDGQPYWRTYVRAVRKED